MIAAITAETMIAAITAETMITRATLSASCLSKLGVMKDFIDVDLPT